MDWRSYILPLRDTRYLNLPALPMVLIIAYALYQINLYKKTFLVYALIGLLAVSSFLSMSIRLSGPSSVAIYFESFKRVADIFKTMRPRTLYCDVPSIAYPINYYHRFNPLFKIERSVRLTPDTVDVYVIIHDYREDAPVDKEGIIRSIKAGEVDGSKTYHLKGEEFDLSKWILLDVVKARACHSTCFYIFYIPPG